MVKRNFIDSIKRAHMDTKVEWVLLVKEGEGSFTCILQDVIDQCYTLTLLNTSFKLFKEGIDLGLIHIIEDNGGYIGIYCNGTIMVDYTLRRVVTDQLPLLLGVQDED